MAKAKEVKSSGVVKTAPGELLAIGEKPPLLTKEAYEILLKETKTRRLAKQSEGEDGEDGKLLPWVAVDYWGPLFEVWVEEDRTDEQICNSTPTKEDFDKRTPDGEKVKGRLVREWWEKLSIPVKARPLSFSQELEEWKNGGNPWADLEVKTTGEAKTDPLGDLLGEETANKVRAFYGTIVAEGDPLCEVCERVFPATLGQEGLKQLTAWNPLATPSMKEQYGSTLVCEECVKAA